MINPLNPNSAKPFFKPDQQLEELAKNILERVWTQFPTLEPKQIAFSWIVYDNPVIVNTGGAISPLEFWQHPVRGYSYRGTHKCYPASIVKLFYLVAVQEWLHSYMIPSSDELNRAIQDMIVYSSNDATSLIIDTLTGTTSGPELPPGPFETWKSQRNIINRYFQSLGWPELENINLCQKTWSDGPYGRERIFLGEFMENRNMLTTEAVARLLHTIVGGVAVSSGRSQEMMALIKRDLDSAESESEEEDQVMGFLGEGLPSNGNIWSKAGWTSQVRHDAAYIEIPEFQPYLLVVFTEGKNYSKNKQLLPFISQEFVKAMSQI